MTDTKLTTNTYLLNRWIRNCDTVLSRLPVSCLLLFLAAESSWKNLRITSHTPFSKASHCAFIRSKFLIVATRTWTPEGSLTLPFSKPYLQESTTHAITMKDSSLPHSGLCMCSSVRKTEKVPKRFFLSFWHGWLILLLPSFKCYLFRGLSWQIFSKLNSPLPSSSLLHHMMFSVTLVTLCKVLAYLSSPH